jgi:hypothetical protein
MVPSPITNPAALVATLRVVSLCRPYEQLQCETLQMLNRKIQKKIASKLNVQLGDRGVLCQSREALVLCSRWLLPPAQPGRRPCVPEAPRALGSWPWWARRRSAGSPAAIIPPAGTPDSRGRSAIQHPPTTLIQPSSRITSFTRCSTSSRSRCQS